MTGNRATGPSYGDLLEICALNDGFPNQIDILLRDTRMSNEDPVQLQIISIQDILRILDKNFVKVTPIFFAYCHGPVFFRMDLNAWL